MFNENAEKKVKKYESNKCIITESSKGLLNHIINRKEERHIYRNMERLYQKIGHVIQIFYIILSIILIMY